MPTPEGRVKAKVDRLLKAKGVWYFSPQAGPYGRSGIPDRIAVVRGIFVGIECKADPYKKPTALQLECMRQIEDAGGKCFVVDSQSSLDIVEQWIDDTLELPGS